MKNAGITKNKVDSSSQGAHSPTGRVPTYEVKPQRQLHHVGKYFSVAQEGLKGKSLLQVELGKASRW